MKILMMTNCYFPLVGGLEHSIRSFSREFRKMGHEVMIAAPSWDERASDEEYVIRLPSIKKFNHTEFSVNVPLPGIIPKIFKTFAPDIIHSHHPFFLGDIALRMSRQYRIPLVFTYHIMFEKYVHYLPVRNDKARRFVVELAAGYSNLAHQVIAPSNSVREVLIERGVTTPIEVVASGIDLEQFSRGDRARYRKRYGIADDAFVIGHVGRLAPEKNLDFLTGSLIRFLKLNPSAHVLIIGHGPTAVSIEEAFQSAGFKDRLHLTGTLHDQDLVDAYYAMDVFAFSSLSETQGMVMVEAMAAGVPVVALDATGVRDVINDYVNGRLIKDADEDHFAQVLDWYRTSPDDLKNVMKQQARLTARGFSRSTCALKMAKIYQHLQERALVHDGAGDNVWTQLRERMKAEWDLFKNLMEAGEVAIQQSGVDPSLSKS